MVQPIKCENCGAVLDIEKENRLQFCPYCKTKIQIPETELDHEKYVLEHNEKVRKQQVKEKNKEFLIGMALVGFCIFVLFLIAYVF